MNSTIYTPPLNGTVETAYASYDEYLAFLSKQNTLVLDNIQLKKAENEAQSLYQFVKNTRALSYSFRFFNGMESVLSKKIQGLSPTDEEAIKQTRLTIQSIQIAAAELENCLLSKEVVDIFNNFKGIKKNVDSRVKSLRFDDDKGLVELKKYINSGTEDLRLLHVVLLDLKEKISNTSDKAREIFQSRANSELSHVQNEMTFGNVRESRKSVAALINEIQKYESDTKAHNERLAREEEARRKAAKLANDKLVKNILIGVGVIIALMVIVPVIIEHWVGLLITGVIILFIVGKLNE